MPLDGFDHQLLWSEFTKLQTSPAGSDADGKTKAGSKLSYTFARGEGRTIVVKTADVAIFMDTKRSWVVDGKMTDELLKHEQGHYDITALGVREFYEAFRNFKGKDAKSLDEKILAAGESAQKKIDAVNKRYDGQTEHFRKKAEQEKWNKAIAAEKQKSDGSLDNLP